MLAGRYRLGARLGAGGVATVLEAHDEVLDRDVAVKVLHDGLAVDPVFRARFTREALHVSGLSHPGLVPVLDAGEDEGTAYLVLELVRGRTLRQVLAADGPLSVARSLEIAAALCETLSVTHSAGVVHRDIKPANVMLADDGRTRLLDFGIAQVAGADPLTATSTMVGTAAYLSPEQALGRSAGPQSDLYAVGCVLVEMLTGRPPFSADTPVGLLYRHVHDDPAPPSLRRADVPPQVDAVTARLLAKDAADRPPGAEVARAELLAAVPVDDAVLDLTSDAGRDETVVLIAPPDAAVLVAAMLPPPDAAARLGSTLPPPDAGTRLGTTPPPPDDGTRLGTTLALGPVVPVTLEPEDGIADEEGPTTRAPLSSRHPRLALVGAFAALALLAGVLLAAQGAAQTVADRAPSVRPSPSTAATPSVTATPKPTPTAPPSPTARAAVLAVPRAGSGRAALDAVARVLREGQAAGLVTADAVHRLTPMIDDVRHALGRGHGHPALARLGALQDAVATLESQGEITGAAVPALDAALAQVAALVPTDG